MIKSKKDRIQSIMWLKVATKLHITKESLGLVWIATVKLSVSCLL